MSKRNMNTVRKLLEAVWTEGDFALLPEVMDDKVTYHAMPLPETLEGIDQYRHLMAVFKSVFADLTFTVEDQFAGGDKVATRWTGRLSDGDGDGEKEMTVRGMTITRHDATGKIVDGWDSWDTSKIQHTAGASSILSQLAIAI